MTREGLCILFYAITFSYLESEVIALFIYIPRLVFTPEPDLLKFEISRVEFKKTPHNIILPIQPIIPPLTFYYRYMEREGVMHQVLIDISSKALKLNNVTKFIYKKCFLGFLNEYLLH